MENITLAVLAAVEKELGGSQYQGFTRHIIADSDMVTLDLMIRPDTDLDSRFEAWDRDALELVRVNGWLFSIEDAESDDNEPLPADTVVPSRFDVVTGTALSSWASYLINGDSSGIDADEKAQADAFAAWLGGSIVDCKDAGFRWYHDGSQFGALAGDCQTYTALVERESSR